MKTILLTGCAGFIGYHLTMNLIKHKFKIIGIDNLNSYYDLDLKKKRLNNLIKQKNFKFLKIDISKKNIMRKLSFDQKINLIINLAAQAGIRNSLKNPHRYIDSNISGFLNIIELANRLKIKKIYYASSSSVYGNNKKFPFKETDNIDKPLQFYAITKATNEMMAYTYSKLYNLYFTGFRFFTVYGPFGRPDMAIYKFSKNISNGKKIEIYGDGNHIRDITYVEDIVTKICKVIKKDNIFKDQTNSKIFNIGGGSKIKVIEIIKILENLLNKKAKLIFKDKIGVDMISTESSNLKIENYINFYKKTNPETGLKKFIEWFKEYEKKS